MPGYSLSGTPTDNVAGVIVVAAGKTVTFPQSLTFPSALGTNGFQLTTDGAGALTWATAGISGITIGTTTANGTAGRVLYTDGALVQQYAISGTGSVAMTNAPTLVTPVLGAATATSINGTFIGSSANLTRFVSMASGVSYINLEGNSVGGYIDTSATVGGTSYSGGYISTAGGLTSLGGNINTSGSGSNAGGNITTSGGGGTIDTTGNGSIGLGIAANRTYLVSTAGNNEKTATFPNVTGTVAVAATSATATQALFATATAGAPAYREIATADIATALTTPGAIGGTTASTGAFTTLSGTSTLTLGVVSATAGTIVLRNATNAFTTTIVPSVVTASRQLNLPLITGTDTVAVLGLAQTFTGNKTFSGTVSCGSTLAVSSTTTMTGRLTANGGITVVGGLYLLTTNSALSDGSSINTGTLTNAPDVGNPTKWIAINDNGTERYIPTWTLPPA
jgi:fibronectin-binding autotransporter adhesin